MVDIFCWRIHDIADPNNPYRQESHACFVCSKEFLPDPEYVCEKCNWLKCPHCEGCRCNLTQNDQEWVAYVRRTFCQDPKRMAGLDINSMPRTDNPNVFWGLTSQLRICRSKAVEYLKQGGQNGSD